MYIVWFCSKPDSTDTSLSSMATLHRFEYQADRHTMIHLHDVLIQPFIDSFKTPPKKLILDFDATDNPIHGDQVGKYFNRYYDHHCFYPCMCFVVIDC
nr:transposase [Gynuella sunshinyii]